MATGNEVFGRRTAGRGRRGRTIALALGGVALVLLALWFLPALRSRAEAGTAYGARIGCSCRFVAGRLLSDCARDFEPGMAMVRLSEDPAAKSVTARVPLLGSDTARFVSGAGCRLDPWRR
jgi:hypothetical protein